MGDVGGGGGGERGYQYQAPPQIDFNRIAQQMNQRSRSEEYLEVMRVGQRSLADKLFYRIGTVYLSGITAGGSYGIFEGLRKSSGMGFKLRVNSVLNASGRGGARLGNGLGVAALYYTFVEHGLYRLRNEEDDWMNHVAAGAAAGVLFKCTRGFVPMGIAGAVGAVVGFAFPYVERKLIKVSRAR